MAIEGQIKSLLEPLFPGGVWPMKNTSKEITYPYATYQLISGIPRNTLKGDGGIDKCQYQIDVVSDSYGDVKRLIKAVRNEMNGAPFKNIPVFSMDTPQEGSTLFGGLIQFSIWA